MTTGRAYAVGRPRWGQREGEEYGPPYGEVWEGKLKARYTKGQRGKKDARDGCWEGDLSYLNKLRKG